MLKRTILLVIGLYIILGFISFFKFGLYHYIAEKPKWKSAVYNEASQDFGKRIQDPQTEAAKESQDFPSDMETNN
jgi:hypothetical protein